MTPAGISMALSHHPSLIPAAAAAGVCCYILYISIYRLLSTVFWYVLAGVLIDFTCLYWTKTDSPDLIRPSCSRQLHRKKYIYFPTLFAYIAVFSPHYLSLYPSLTLPLLHLSVDLLRVSPQRIIHYYSLKRKLIWPPNLSQLTYLLRLLSTLSDHLPIVVFEGTR